MSKSPILLIDAPYLCKRAQYTTGALEHAGKKTGTVYGFIRALLDIRKRFGADRVAFCFDGQDLKRCEIYPGYKQARRDRIAGLSPEEHEMEMDYRRQVEDLRIVHLPGLGFRNVFYQTGYEADDIIADLTKKLRLENKIVIVSSDHDLFQLLHKNVEIWNATKSCLWSLKWFRDEYGIPANLWPQVKAIAGCGSDSIPGLEKVGEATAAKYVRGELKFESPLYARIQQSGELIARNMKLVALPLAGLRDRFIVPDQESNDKWSRFFAAHAFHSLRDYIPGLPKYKQEDKTGNEKEDD